MTKEKAKRIAKEYDGKVYENYSGRGMFGETTFGVVLSYIPIRFSKLNFDSLGKGYIIY